MKKPIKKEVELEFEVGKTYKTKFATADRFTISEIKRNSKGVVIGFVGVYESTPNLGNCPLNADRLYPEKTVLTVGEVEICDACKQEIKQA